MSLNSLLNEQGQERKRKKKGKKKEKAWKYGL